MGSIHLENCDKSLNRQLNAILVWNTQKHTYANKPKSLFRVVELFRFFFLIFYELTNIHFISTIVHILITRIS